MANEIYQKYVLDKLTLSDVRKQGKLKVPSFQRGIVWSKQHRKEFIETVKNGDPFGVVLVSQEHKSDPYYLIDGLQRLSTLKAYMENPLEFVDENDKFIDKDSLRSILTEKYKFKGVSLPLESKLCKEEKTFLKKMIAYMKSFKVMPKANVVWKEACNALGIQENAIHVLYAFSEFYDKFVENLELPDTVIHAIVYQGPKERLPAVFETLNTTSVSLTKYEVFSSQWSDTKIVVNDDALVKKVWSKYEDLKKSSAFDVEVDEESIRTNGMTLFEYCFGVSELLGEPSKSYSYLFGKGKKSTDPTGFELLALACGLPVNKADDLWKDDWLGGASGAFLVNLKDALLDAVSFVGDVMHDWVFDLKDTPIKNSSGYQIYYMIMTVFKHMYALNAKNKELKKVIDKTWLNNFKKNAHKWYFYQQISGFWNQHRQVSDLKALIDEDDNERFSKNISKDTWDEALDGFLKRLRESATGRSIDSESKLFLNYLYRLLILEDANRAKYLKKTTADGTKVLFDIEHIVPYAKFNCFDDDLPCSALGNLCYLPVKDNRAKGEATIYEYAADRPSLTFKQEFLDIIDYPSKNDLSFIDCPFAQFKPAYEKFFQAREKRLVARFVKLIL